MSQRRPARRVLAAVGLATALAVLGSGCATRGVRVDTPEEAAVRQAVIARARVWNATRVATMNLRTGPTGPGAFAPNALVDCTFVDKEMSGKTPKFECRLADGSEVKVKYGQDNGEVYAEVAATRLLWALGFGADHMYPVRVRCHECPPDPTDPKSGPRGLHAFDAAAIERKMPGQPYKGPGGEGWAWPELERVRPRAGGASLAQRDALKLLAAMLQHTDSKAEQQRLVCAAQPAGPGSCTAPFMLISDVGKTFGKANLFNRDKPGAVNLQAWSESPVWLDGPGCRAKLSQSLTGTLENPTISDEGRRFLAARLAQLTDRQLWDLFSVARFPMRDGARSDDEQSRDVDAWVRAFKEKVAQITNRSCLIAATSR